MLRSLTKRIIALSIGWIAFALLGTCVLLWWLYHAHMQDHYDARVSTHLEELVAAVVLPEGQLQLRRNPTDPRFQRLNSGWYWEIRPKPLTAGLRVVLSSALFVKFEYDWNKEKGTALKDNQWQVQLGLSF